MGEELITAFSGAITSIKGDVTSLMSAAVGPALAIAGIGIALSFGKRFFTSLAA